MASARQNVEIVERRVGVVLELSDEEADVLFYLLHRIGGDDVRSPRRHAQAILEALRVAGRTHNSPEYAAVAGEVDDSLGRGGIRFFDSAHYRNLDRRCG